MNRKKLIRITTIPLSLEKLLEGQLTFMQQYYDLTAISAEKERLEKYGQDNGVATFHLEMTREMTPLQDLKAVLKLYKFLIREKPLIVHTHTPKAGIIGMLAAKLAGVPIRLHTVAGMPLMEATGVKRRILNSVEKLTYTLATHVFPNSEGLRSIILKEKFTKPEKLKVLGKGSSNGIDSSYFNPNLFSEEENRGLKKSLNIPPKDIIYIFIGRLVGDKGINELVEAFDELYETNKNISLLLVGPFEQDLDPLKKENLRLIEEHPKIFSMGYKVDVRPYLALAYILVFPSYREGFPNVVLQAGAMGLPAIVSDINGCNEIIKHHQNGLIIPVKNKSALQESMLYLLEHPEERIQMAARARESITSSYDRKEFWEELLREYKKLESQLLKT